jgi:glutamine amidotransferase
MVGLINYGLGNIRAVEKALERLSIPFLQLSRPDDAFDSCTHFILPGVGHFETGMRNLESSGLAKVIQSQSAKKKPILGICLGMQLFATRSEEGNCPGLNLIKRDVMLLDPPMPGAKIPHVGWNKIVFQNDSGLFEGIDTSERFYFVHSYYFPNLKSKADVGIAIYFGSEICAVVEEGNIVGVQFHPEKSHDAGLKIFTNFYRNYG